jgi:hypothetical protein
VLLWTSLRNGLIHFSGLGSEIFLWGIPIAAIVLEAINAYFGTSQHLPLILFLTFLVAVPMGAAHLIYNMRCPLPLKGVATEGEWREKATREQEQILAALNKSEEIKKVLSQSIENEMEDRLRTNRAAWGLSESQISIIKEELKFSAVAVYTSTERHLSSLTHTTMEEFDRLNISRATERCACGFFLAFALVSALVEILSRIGDVLESRFGVDLWSWIPTLESAWHRI